MKLHEYIENYLNETGESPDVLAKRSGVGRASVFRAKRQDGDPRFSTVQQIVSAIGYPLVISPEQKSSPANDIKLP